MLLFGIEAEEAADNIAAVDLRHRTAEALAEWRKAMEYADERIVSAVHFHLNCLHSPRRHPLPPPFRIIAEFRRRFPLLVVFLLQVHNKLDVSADDTDGLVRYKHWYLMEREGRPKQKFHFFKI